MLSVYKDKKILITGHTGFKGSWLSIWLHQLGAEVIGVSDRIVSTPSNYVVSNVSEFVKDLRIDICDSSALQKVVLEEEPDFVFHLAAQALVRPSYEGPIETMRVNAIGTACVLDALRMVKKETIALMITSDKAYDNVEWTWGYRENDALGGKDPYSASKGMAELVIRSYLESYFKPDESKVKIGIARAGNVIGGGDWALDRIVPDCIRAWARGDVVEIRSPRATRPWQHVLEPLSGYLNLGAKLASDPSYHGEAFNFGPSAHNNQTVSDLINEMKSHWNNVNWEDVSLDGSEWHEAGLLKLNCDKALAMLRWMPTLDFSETVKMTIDWYREFYAEQENMLELCVSQVESYSDKAASKNIEWATNKNYLGEDR